LKPLAEGVAEAARLARIADVIAGMTARKWMQRRVDWLEWIGMDRNRVEWNGTEWH